MNANSMSVSLVLFIAKVCLGLLIAQVWNHKLARSESCEYLLLRVRSYTPSGVTPIYLTSSLIVMQLAMTDQVKRTAPR